MKLKVQAQHLQAGDIVGSGEKVEYVGRGAWTPAHQVDVVLSALEYSKNRKIELIGRKNRSARWGKYTMINVERPGNPQDIILKLDRIG